MEVFSKKLFDLVLSFGQIYLRKYTESRKSLQNEDAYCIIIYKRKY